jgi:hypothetical protein
MSRSTLEYFNPVEPAAARPAVSRWSVAAICAAVIAAAVTIQLRGAAPAGLPTWSLLVVPLAAVLISYGGVFHVLEREPRVRGLRLAGVAMAISYAATGIAVLRLLVGG